MTKPCVLVIDDEAVMCETLKAILETEDYDVLTTGDARDGLNVVNKEPVNLIISDVRLPGMSGIKFLSAIKENFPSIPVMMISAFGDMKSAVDAMKRGAFDYLAKPFQPEELLVAGRAHGTAATGGDHQPGAQLATVGKAHGVLIDNRHLAARQQSRRRAGAEHVPQMHGQISRTQPAIRQIYRPLEARKRHPVTRPGAQRQTPEPPADIRRHITPVKAPGVVAGRPRVALDQPQAQARMRVQQRQRDQATVQARADDQHVERRRCGAGARVVSRVRRQSH